MKFKGFALVLYAMAATHLLNAEMVYAMGSSSDTPTAEKAANSDFAQGKKLIDAKQWEGAIVSFTKVVTQEPENADAYNYLGYANRNIGQYDAAFTAYNKALSINPEHKGANEYIGEAYLQTGNLAKAEEHLKKLDEICTFGCAEYTMLQRAVAEYRGKNS